MSESALEITMLIDMLDGHGNRVRLGEYCKMVRIKNHDRELLKQIKNKVTPASELGQLLKDIK